MDYGGADGGTTKPRPGRWSPPADATGEHAREEIEDAAAVVRAPTLLPDWVTAVLDGDKPAPELVPMRLVPGELVPGTRYRIQRWLGDGGMGVVYEAEHADVDRRVALKILRPEICEHPDVIERFRNEARAANRVGSEHIAEVYDFAELPDGRLLFAMELLEGKTLAAELSEGPMAVGRAIGVLRQLCKGLAEAHEAEIVHRDIKPDNIILVRRRGRDDYVKIMDLGIATLLVDGRAVASKMAGTPHYVAPEIVGGQTFDHRVDVYSVGCTAYEMLVGHPPFEGESITAVLIAHLEQEPVPPSHARPDGELPPGLDGVILNCLAKHPKDRYRDMRDLEAALCEAQIEAGLHTPWDDLPVPDVEDARKERLLREMPDPRMFDRPTSSGWIWPVLSVLAIAGVLAVGWYWSPSRQATQFERDHVDTLVDDAREAASKSLYVVPAVEAPDAATAYSYVIEIEGTQGPAAKYGRERAAQLRREFADTLLRLGDRYWAAEGGQAFATEYYAQALVFDPQNPRAQARTSSTPARAQALREQADRGAFTDQELEMAEPLLVLAEEDPAERQQKLVDLREKERARAQQRRDQLEKLAGVDGEGVGSAKPVGRPSASPAVAGAGGAGQATEKPPEKPTSERDPAEAERLVELAKKNLSVGNSGQASELFGQALDHDPRSGPALIGLSDISFFRGDYAGAAVLAERAVAVAPRRASYRVRLARAYEKLGRAEDAKAQYERVDALNAK